MQYLIATTFEVVHYIALQAVYYKPLQEVHLSRYNHLGVVRPLFPVSVLHQTTTYACISSDYQRYIYRKYHFKNKGSGLKKYVKDLKKFQLPWIGLQFFLNLALEVQDIPVLFVGNAHN